MTTAVRRVVVTFAMQEEAAPFIANCNLQRIPPNELGWPATLPVVAYRGTVAMGDGNDDGSGSCEVFACWNGKDQRFSVNNVATTAAAVASYAAVCEFHPDLVISAGTAGGFRSSTARIGDVFLSSKCIFHSRRIPSGKNLEEYGFGHFRSPPLAGLARRCRLKVGVVSTSDSLDATPRDLELLRAEGAAVKEMEAAAIAWVCQQLHVPFFALKSITDIVDKHDNNDLDLGLRQPQYDAQRKERDGRGTPTGSGGASSGGGGVGGGVGDERGDGDGDDASADGHGDESMDEEQRRAAAGATREQFERNLAKASANLQVKLVHVLRCLGGHSLADWRTTAPSKQSKHAARL